jgi:hypothetical protein
VRPSSRPYLTLSAASAQCALRISRDGACCGDSRNVSRQAAFREARPRSVFIITKLRPRRRTADEHDRHPSTPYHGWPSSADPHVSSVLIGRFKCVVAAVSSHNSAPSPTLLHLYLLAMPAFVLMVDPGLRMANTAPHIRAHMLAEAAIDMIRRCPLYAFAANFSILAFSALLVHARKLDLRLAHRH